MDAARVLIEHGANVPDFESLLKHVRARQSANKLMIKVLLKAMGRPASVFLD